MKEKVEVWTWAVSNNERSIHRRFVSEEDYKASREEVKELKELLKHAKSKYQHGSGFDIQWIERLNKTLTKEEV